jgi:adenine phosphoribosyltransferase
VSVQAESLAQRLRAAIRDVPNFPKPGIVFKDITPVLSDAALFRDIIHHLAMHYADQHIDAIAGIESRGFLFGAPLAIQLQVPFVPFRKVGKLPHHKVRVDYALEYGADSIEAHADAIGQGTRVLVVDDVLATGGTAEASGRLVKSLGGELAGFCIPIELGFLDGRSRLEGAALHTLVRF